MKNKLLLFLIPAMAFTACADWLDVSPNTEVKSDILFSTEDGFKSALTGIYARMTNDQLYGRELEFGFMESLVQRFDNYKPGSVTDAERAKIYDYANQEASKEALKMIWSEMYKNIANVNNLLAKLEEKGDVITSPGYFELIKGEALGLRAFHYFELLRMWGPIYMEDSTAVAIPWRDQFNADQAPLMPANVLVAKIINDLREAEKLLENDPMNMEGLFEAPFLSYRQHRMNKYAVKAMLARVYLYRGDKVNAARYAREVIDNSGISLATENIVDNSMFGEHIFSLNIFNMKEKMLPYFEATVVGLDQQLWVTKENVETVFETKTIGGNDIRGKQDAGFMYNDLEDKHMLRKFLSSSNAHYREKMPLIRMAEMYYILAESVPVEESVDYLNRVRNIRGIPRIYNLKADANYNRENELMKEYQKEFFGEGQFFYFLKRFKRPTFHRCPLENGMKPEHYIFRIPDDEVEFGQTTTTDK